MANIDELRERIKALEFEARQYKSAADQIAQIVNNLNNMLAVMRGHAQMASANPTEEDVQELIQVVLSSTARAEQEIRNALGQDKAGKMAAKTLEKATARKQARILVVDDEELIRELLYELLTKSGHDVVVAENADKALKACKKGPFDVVFMDLRLGKTNGVEVFRQVKQLLPGARYLFLSGDPKIEEVWQIVRKEGADGFIHKPFDINEIDVAVSHILGVPPAVAAEE